MTTGRRLGLGVLVLLPLLAGCAVGASLDRSAPPAARPALRFGVDTFAFANESRSKNPDKPDLYANYCFVMARAINQFLRFARFDPAAPRLDGADYTRLVARVTHHPPWGAPLPPGERVLIPGYPSLYELSREQEAAVKEGLGSRLWTLLHWTNWRVGLPVPGWHQEAVASDVLDEIHAGWPAQLLVTNLPTWELNHTVVAFDARAGEAGTLEFVVYDPNDPNTPGVLAYDVGRRRFVARRLHDTEPGVIRAFRMYHHPLL
jgi:hypothetical protein